MSGSGGARPLAVVCGFIAKLPVAGMTLYNTHYLEGLQELGYDVFYVERQNESDECYDPRTNGMTDDSSFGRDYLARELHALGISGYAFIDLDGTCHGAGWNVLEETLAHADFVLTLADPTWFDELELCTRRAFVDGDPLFTQAAMLSSDETPEKRVANYETLFTYATRLGADDCTVPDVGRSWITTTPVVATRRWPVDLPPEPRKLPVTNVLNWSAWSDIRLNGSTYGHKNRSFEPFLDLPARTRDELVLAVGGPAPKEILLDSGWTLVDPIAATTSLDTYRDFIARSKADLGIAKHAYVASRCGWFSDRSTCYLAAGRPVLHQDTGFTDWLEPGEGVLAFSEPDDVVAALEELDRDYERHARAARRIAEEVFEARVVVGEMLDAAGFR
jgi:glycosyl transferase family 1